MWSAISIGIGAMIGAGIFSILGVAGQIAGSAMWVLFVAAGLVAFLSAYSFAKLGVTYPSAGGPAEYLGTRVWGQRRERGLQRPALDELRLRGLVFSWASKAVRLVTLSWPAEWALASLNLPCPAIACQTARLRPCSDYQQRRIASRAVQKSPPWCADRAPRGHLCRNSRRRFPPRGHWVVRTRGALQRTVSLLVVRSLSYTKKSATFFRLSASR